MYVENVMEVARVELAWEVDYVREAECGRRFRLTFYHLCTYLYKYVLSEKNFNLTSSLHVKCATSDHLTIQRCDAK